MAKTPYIIRDSRHVSEEDVTVNYVHAAHLDMEGMPGQAPSDPPLKIRTPPANRGGFGKSLLRSAPPAPSPSLPVCIASDHPLSSIPAQQLNAPHRPLTNTL